MAVTASPPGGYLYPPPPPGTDPSHLYRRWLFPVTRRRAETLLMTMLLAAAAGVQTAVTLAAAEPGAPLGEVPFGVAMMAAGNVGTLWLAWRYLRRRLIPPWMPVLLRWTPATQPGHPPPGASQQPSPMTTPRSPGPRPRPGPPGWYPLDGFPQIRAWWDGGQFTAAAGPWDQAPVRLPWYRCRHAWLRSRLVHVLVAAELAAVTLLDSAGLGLMTAPTLSWPTDFETLCYEPGAITIGSDWVTPWLISLTIACGFSLCLAAARLVKPIRDGWVDAVHLLAWIVVVGPPLWALFILAGTSANCSL